MKKAYSSQALSCYHQIIEQFVIIIIFCGHKKLRAPSNERIMSHTPKMNVIMIINVDAVKELDVNRHVSGVGKTIISHKVRRADDLM